MAVDKIAMADKLGQLIRRYVDDHYSLELLRFFGGYPHARFSELAVVHALNSNHGTMYIRGALRQLVDKGVVKISTDNNVSLYALTEDESLCNLASDLAKLDWHQWQLVFRQTYPIPGVLIRVSQ
ncbi:MAG: hypothetical protein HW402_1546 [Dehalococcoidales bacterium]|nr:hypothetical protein [Dehalococcoidales bacterium]